MQEYAGPVGKLSVQIAPDREAPGRREHGGEALSERLVRVQLADIHAGQFRIVLGVDGQVFPAGELVQGRGLDAVVFAGEKYHGAAIGEKLAQFGDGGVIESRRIGDHDGGVAADVAG